MLPKNLQITPEKQEQIDAEQKEWATRSPFATPSGLQMEMSNASVFLRDMEQAIKDGLKPDNALKSRMAESYAVLGQYDEAIKLEKDKIKRREYLEVLEAINRDDDDFCTCENQKGDIELTNQYVKKEIFSPKHNKLMPVVTCRSCGHSNVTYTPKDLTKLRQARKLAVAMRGNHKTTKEVLR